MIDPGQAFGTGAHPTTRLSLELLLELDPGGSLADLGCGSGVLAIAAAKLGFAPWSRSTTSSPRSTRRAPTRAANGVELDAVERVDLRERPAPAADTVAANLVRPLLGGSSWRAARARLIVSGLLEDEADEVAAAFGAAEHRRLRRGRLGALLLEVGSRACGSWT